MFEMLLGHLVGDYLLQNDWMALNKNKQGGLAWSACFIHCWLYTVAVCAFTQLEVKWFLIVFLSHFIIDKWSLSDWWGKVTRGRTISEFLVSEEAKTYSPHMALRAGINVFVYIVRDNTMHLVLMYWGWKLLYGGV